MLNQPLLLQEQGKSQKSSAQFVNTMAQCKMGPNFEDYLQAEEFKHLFSKANISDKEVIRRTLGYKSSFLGKGRTKNTFLRGAVKLLVSVFLREPMEAKVARIQANPERTETPLQDYDDLVEESNGKKLSNSNDQTCAEIVAEKDEFTQVKINKICKDWAKNKCKRGSKCRFMHPDLCDKFAKFGPHQKSNPRGCDKSCNLFHPRGIWCMQALKHGSCKHGKECKYNHFRGVRFEMKSQKMHQSHQNIFLHKDVQLKKEKASRPQRHTGDTHASKLNQGRSYASIVQGDQSSFLGNPSLSTVMMDVVARLGKMEEWMRRTNQCPGNSPWQH